MSGKPTLLARLLGTGAALAAVSASGNRAAADGSVPNSDQTIDLENLTQRAFEEGRTQGMSEGVTAERQRFGTVLTSDRGARNAGLAITLLSTTDNTVEQIDGALAAIDKPAAAPTAPAPAATVETPQAPAVDPIASATPLVSTGVPGAAEDGKLDKAAVDALWDKSMGREASILAGGGFAVAGYRPQAA